MAVARTLINYLKAKGVDYEMVEHAHTPTAVAETVIIAPANGLSACQLSDEIHDPRNSHPHSRAVSSIGRM